MIESSPKKDIRCSRWNKIHLIESKSVSVFCLLGDVLVSKRRGSRWSSDIYRELTGRSRFSSTICELKTIGRSWLQISLINVEPNRRIGLIGQVRRREDECRSRILFDFGDRMKSFIFERNFRMTHRAVNKLRASTVDVFVIFYSRVNKQRSVETNRWLTKKVIFRWTMNWSASFGGTKSIDRSSNDGLRHSSSLHSNIRPWFSWKEVLVQCWRRSKLT